MGNEVFSVLGISLALTLLFELAFCLGFRVRGWHDLILAVLVNVLTNPVVVLSYLLLSEYTGHPKWAIALPLELMAFLVEALCYKHCSNNIRRPFLLSFGANAFSFLCGLVVSMIF